MVRPGADVAADVLDGARGVVEVAARRRGRRGRRGLRGRAQVVVRAEVDHDGVGLRVYVDSQSCHAERTAGWADDMSVAAWHTFQLLKSHSFAAVVPCWSEALAVFPTVASVRVHTSDPRVAPPQQFRTMPSPDLRAIAHASPGRNY